ncbi:hypothetical protein HMPREF3198_00784 [Winkia neuii]|nr:hypothetical protein HMPREF3198_00784 [Winkia neuii]
MKQRIGKARRSSTAIIPVHYANNTFIFTNVKNTSLAAGT